MAIWLQTGIKGLRIGDNPFEAIWPVQYYYSTICKSELRSRDRRVAQSVPNILKKLQMKQIQGSASLSLCKCKTKGKTYTAGDLKSETSVNKLINLDEHSKFSSVQPTPKSV